MGAWHWLVANDLWHAVVATLVSIPAAVLTAWAPWKRHRASQRRIADLLDTTTPGGLADLNETLKSLGRDGLH